jgi:hypothetical protein
VHVFNRNAQVLPQRGNVNTLRDKIKISKRLNTNYLFKNRLKPLKSSGFQNKMTSLEISYEIEYLSCELADERIENKPILTTYFDAHFIRSEAEGGIVNTHLDEHDLDKVYEATLKARVPSGTASVPITAAIGFAHYAQRRNEFGMACYTNAGTGHVKMVEILSTVERGKVFEKRIPLIMETTKLLGEPVRKGEILFRAKSVKKGNRVSFLPLDRCILGDLASPKGMQSNADIISQFIQKRVEFEANMNDTWEGIKNVRAPMDISSAGIELTGTCFVPVEGFALCETLDINEEYYQNAFERSMIRKGFSNPSVGFRSLDMAHKAEVLAEVTVYAAQSFDYISDTVDLSKRGPPPPKGSKPLISALRPDTYRRIGFEDFHNSAVTASGDCEDGSGNSNVIFHNFKRLEINANTYPELKELQTIASDYVYFHTLATVHGARVNDEKISIGAHMYGLLLPKDQVKMCLSTTVEGKVWAERLPLDQKIDTLPTLFCEGTGRIRPLGTGPVELHSLKTHHVSELVRRSLVGANSPNPSHPISYDPLFAERMYVGRNMHSRGGMKALISHDWGAESSFYLGNLLVVTTEFMDVGENLGAFVCGNIDREQGTITRGSKFVDLIRQENTVALIPCAPIPPKIMEITREAATLRAPCRSFVLERNKIDPKLKTHPDLERLKNTINGLGRTGQAPFGGVSTYIRPHQVNKTSVDKMISNIIQMKAVFKIDVEFEPITTDLHQFRLITYVDKNQI